MEKDTTTQVENDERFAWFNGNNKISIGTIDLNEDILSYYKDILNEFKSLKDEYPHIKLWMELEEINNI